MKNIEKLVKDYNSIEFYSDLKKRNLSLADYRTIEKILTELKITGSSEFTQIHIKGYFEKFSIPCRPCGTGWEIEL